MTRRDHRIALCLASLILLAGCAGDAGPTIQAGFDSDHLGRLQGTVIDDSFVPIEGSELILDGLHRTLSGPDGGFSFDVEPGRHEVTAVKEGFAPATIAAEVVAGESQHVVITMVPIAKALSYYETRIQSDQIGCSTGYRINTPNTSYFAACALGSLVTNTSQIDSPFLNWNIGSAWSDIIGFWGETMWRSTQAVGSGMSIQWFVLDVRFGGTASYKIVGLNRTEGRSPLGVKILIEDLRKAVANQATGVGPVCPETEATRDCWLLSGHYAAARTTNQAADVGLTLQQRYTDYLTIFHGALLPESFSALPEG